MNNVMDGVLYLRDQYEYALLLADKRVANWLLMDSYLPTLLLTLTYLLSIFVGTVLMRNREPFNFKYTLFFYNASLVALNFHIFYELATVTWKLNYSYTCQLVDYSEDPDEMRIAHALWWYYFSKLIEFLDTIFFVLRKKNNQISFLHVYHHATMFPIWWIGIKWTAGGQAFFGAMINSFIHVLMYSYYAISSLGPEYQKYLGWKRYLTRIQLIQFIVGMAHAANSIISGCQFPLWMQWALIGYGFSILTLFLNFYFQAYIKPSKVKKQKLKTNGTTHISNGFTNGYINEKKLN